MGPVIYTIAVGASASSLLLYFRSFFTQPQVAWAILNLSLLAAGWAMTDPNFRSIVTKADNVPIAMLIFSVGFFTWLALYRGRQQRRPHGHAASRCWRSSTTTRCWSGPTWSTPS